MIDTLTDSDNIILLKEEIEKLKSEIEALKTVVAGNERNYQSDFQKTRAVVNDIGQWVNPPYNYNGYQIPY